jgi:glutamyl-tRNA reductase
MQPRKLLPPEDARQRELERALRRLAAGASPDRVLEDLSRRLANKLLHGATLAIGERKVAAQTPRYRRWTSGF